MRDPFSWSLPLGRLFGIDVRMHWLFPVVALGLVLRVAMTPEPTMETAGYLPGSWKDMAMLMALLLVVVLLHEFGHCAGARYVEGDATEVLIWPLGGLANVEVPHTPRANFIAAAAGPLANLAICLVAGLAFLQLTGWGVRPTWNPFWYAMRYQADGAILLYQWGGQEVLEPRLSVILLARLFWLSWLLFLINVLLIGFPLDGGRMFQCLLWPRLGYRDATLYAVYAGFITAILLGVVAIFRNELLVLCLALFIYVTCRQQWIFLETGGEESLFGYDFSQGYTSLEREERGQAAPTATRRRPNFFQRWLQRRAARKLQRELEQREAEERRMDELLEKIQRQGRQSLTDEEQRFLTRVSAKYRNRQ